MQFPFAGVAPFVFNVYQNASNRAVEQITIVKFSELFHAYAICVLKLIIALIGKCAARNGGTAFT